MKNRKRLTKILLTVSLSAVGLFLLILIFLSPITKYLVEKYDVKIVGREITMDLPYMNPFTGFFHFRNLKFYEQNSDSIFFSTKGLSVNFEVFKALSGRYEVSRVKLTDPKIKVIQNRKHFNFSDIIERFSTKDTIEEPPKEKKEVEWEVRNISIKNGMFSYEEKAIPIFYYIKELNIESEGVGGRSDTLVADFNFKSGPSTGAMEGKFAMNLTTIDYFLKLKIDEFDLAFFERYLSNIANFASVQGTLDADFDAAGNFNDAKNIATTGSITINNCHVGKNPNEDYAAFKKFNLTYDMINPKKNIYEIDSIHLMQPFFKYERYDSLDNLQNMFGAKGEKAKSVNAETDNYNILFIIGEYIKDLSENFFKGDYRVRKIGIYDANFAYNDYSLVERFGLAFNPLTLVIDSIERKNDWVDAVLTAGIVPYGNMYFKMSISPKDSSNFKIDYNIKNVPASIFNPYLLSYTSFPLDRGTIEVKGHWDVSQGVINSQNNLLVIDPRVGLKQKNAAARWLPLKVGMFFVRERGNVIDYEIPIKGDLKNPSVKLKDVILDIIKNIFVKPVTPIYRYTVKTTEIEIENSLLLKWKVRETNLHRKQEVFLKEIARFLDKNPDNTIVVKSNPFEEREKEYISFFEAKKRYLRTSQAIKGDFTKADSMKVEKLSIKDEGFLEYLRRSNQNNQIFTIQEHCRLLLGNARIDSAYKVLLAARVHTLETFFEKKGVLKQVRFEATPNTNIPYDGFSMHRFTYEGDIPAYLLEAYERMMELDEESPRSKYKRKRNEIRKTKRKA
jgi:hypothetical protein